jgi:hypothetical protein
MHGTKRFGIAVLLMAIPSAAVAHQDFRGQPPQPGAIPPPGQFGGFYPPPMMGPGTPELAKKMAAIAALREIHNLRMSAREIGAVIPKLKEMREAERTLEAQAGEALEQEKRALLAAAPDAQVPPASAEKLRAANERFRQAHERSWRGLVEEVGPRIGGGLQRILQGGMGFGPGAGIPGPPSGFTPGQGFNPGPGFPGGGPVRPGLAPPGGDDPPGAPPRPGQGEVGPPPGAPAQPPAGFSQSPRPQPGQGGGRGVGPRPGGQPPPGRFPQPGGQGGPGFGPQGPGGSGMGWQPMTMGPSPRVSLAELIELLEQKLGAMRK